MSKSRDLEALIYVVPCQQRGGHDGMVSFTTVSGSRHGVKHALNESHCIFGRYLATGPILDGVCPLFPVCQMVDFERQVRLRTAPWEQHNVCTILPSNEVAASRLDLSRCDLCNSTESRAGESTSQRTKKQALGNRQSAP